MIIYWLSYIHVIIIALMYTFLNLKTFVYYQILCSNVDYTCTCINVLWFNFISSENINYQGSRTRFELLNTTLSSNQYITNGSVDSWFKSYTDWLDTNPAAASGKTTSKYFVIYGIFLLLINLDAVLPYALQRMWYNHEFR